MPSALIPSKSLISLQEIVAHHNNKALFAITEGDGAPVASLAPFEEAVIAFSQGKLVYGQDTVHPSRIRVGATFDVVTQSGRVLARGIGALAARWLSDEPPYKAEKIAIIPGMGAAFTTSLEVMEMSNGKTYSDARDREKSQAAVQVWDAVATWVGITELRRILIVAQRPYYQTAATIGMPGTVKRRVSDTAMFARNLGEYP